MTAKSVRHVSSAISRRDHAARPQKQSHPHAPVPRSTQTRGLPPRRSKASLLRAGGGGGPSLRPGGGTADRPSIRPPRPGEDPPSSTQTADRSRWPRLRSPNKAASKRKAEGRKSACTLLGRVIDTRRKRGERRQVKVRLVVRVWLCAWADNVRRKTRGALKKADLEREM